MILEKLLTHPYKIIRDISICFLEKKIKPKDYSISISFLKSDFCFSFKTDKEGIDRIYAFYFSKDILVIDKLEYNSNNNILILLRKISADNFLPTQKNSDLLNIIISDILTDIKIKF